MKEPQAIPYRSISLFFILVMVLITWGFYKTYIIFFPKFDGFDNLHHFHGAMMTIWMAFLIVQPLLIRSGRLTTQSDWKTILCHRATGGSVHLLNEQDELSTA